MLRVRSLDSISTALTSHKGACQKATVNGLELKMRKFYALGGIILKSKQRRKYSPMLDTLSKLVLTNHRIAKHFCESILGFEIEIENVSPSPNLMKFQRETSEDKTNRQNENLQANLENKVAETEVDILARLKNGTRIIIEIQRTHQEFFVERAVYYSDKNFVDQFSEILGNHTTHTAYRFLMPVYSINLMEKAIFPEIKSLKLDFEVMDKRHDKILTSQNGVPLKRYIFIQLDQFDSDMEDSQLKYWSQYWRNEPISPEADAEIFEADALIDEESWNQEVQKMVDWEIKLIEDEKARIETAENRGARQNALEVARKMILRGDSPKSIAEVLDISLDDILALQKTLTPSGT